MKRFRFPSSLGLVLASLLLPALADGQVSLVQVSSNPQPSTYTNAVNVAYRCSQAAGNLNIVVVGWSDTSSTIFSVIDSNGNVYAPAAGTVSTPLAAAGEPQIGVSQAIYYARNINAGANTVTVTFNQNTAAQSVRIAEYSGLDQTNPLDNSVGNSGNSVPADSGAVATNSANDLLFGAGTITSAFSGSGPGFVAELLDGFGDIVEDRFVTAIGSYNATAIFGSGSWVMQMAAFRQAGQPAPPLAAPAITSLAPSSGPEAGGVALTIAGTNLQPGAAVIFTDPDGMTAAGVNCSVTLLATPNATISCLTPSFPTGTASVTVTNVDGQTSLPADFTFTVSTPFATAASAAIAPDTGSTNGGNLVTISGSDFAAGAKVTVGEIPADRVSVRNVNTIEASLPASAAGLASVAVRNISGIAGTLPGGYTYEPGTGVNFVQVNSSHPASPAASAPADYLLPQTAGNLNVVIVGWNDDTAAVQSVTDSAGNDYTLALNPTVGTGLSQAIYYARNIHAATSNTVTVLFSPPALSPDVRVLEYSGLDPSAPLEAGAGNSGTGEALDSGPIVTCKAGDLLIGGSTLEGIVIAAGQDFTTVTTTPNGLSVEHLVGAAAGTHHLTATQNMNANWVMQAVAFKPSATVPGFGLSVLPASSASVMAGDPAIYAITVSAIDGFNGPVTLSCSFGLPPGTSCDFVPPVVTPGATAATSTLTITTAAATAAATSNVIVTGTSGSLSEGTSVSLSVSLPAPHDFTMAAAPLSSVSVAAGGVATSTVTIAPAGGFTSAVSLTCGVSPKVARAPTCSFNPASIVDGAGSSVLTVRTTAATVGSLARESVEVLYAMWLPVGGMALLGVPLTSLKKKRLRVLLGGVILCTLILLSACGGSSGGQANSDQPGTPAGNYTITVTGTSGSLTHTTTASIQVQ